MPTRSWMGVLAVVVTVVLLGACGSAAQPASKAASGASAPPAAANPPSAAGAMAAPAPAAPAAPQPKEPITFAIPERSLNYIAVFTAAAQGYFAEAGLDLTPQPMPPNLTVAAFQRGDLQLSAAGGSAARAAVRGGAAIKLVAFMAARPTYYLVTVPEIRTPQQLVGRRIGTTGGADSLAYYLESYTRQVGVDFSQIAVLGMGSDPAARLVAMHAGALDGAVIDPAGAAVAEVQGFHVLKSLGEVTSQPIQSIVASDDFMQHKPAALRGFLKALVRGLLHVKQQPVETAAIARRELSHDLDDSTALRAVQLYGDAISGAAPGYADDQMMEQFYQLDVRVPLEMAPTDPVPVLHDFRPLLQAYDELGIARPR
jgi:NitT/TauT family transport system substrate-binding protein